MSGSATLGGLLRTEKRNCAAASATLGGPIGLGLYGKFGRIVLELSWYVPVGYSVVDGKCSKKKKVSTSLVVPKMSPLEVWCGWMIAAVALRCGFGNYDASLRP